MVARTILVTLASTVALTALPAAAQSVTGSVQMSSDRASVAVGQTFRLTIRADITGSTNLRFHLPRLDDFDVLGRQITRPFNLGAVVQATTVHTYTLRARAPGTYTLEAPVAHVDGQQFRGEPLTLTVTGPGQPAPQQPQQQTPAAPPGQLDGAEVDREAFIRTVVEPERPYVGQQITVSVYLYTRAPLRQAPSMIREPSADGFWVQDLLPPQRTLDATQEVVAGNFYRAYLIKKFAAFPLRAGELEIGAAEMGITTGGAFDLFRAPEQIRREGVPVTVEVRELPEDDAPLRTDAVVGAYRLEARLDRGQVRTGDAVTLTATVRGTGNLRDVRLEVPDIDGLEILASPPEDRVETNSGVVGGERRFTWLIVPQQPGVYELPDLALRVFEPVSGEYTTVRAPELTITAAGNAIVPDEPEEPETVSPEEPTPDTPAPTFGPVRNRSALVRSSEPLSAQAWYLAVLFAMPLLFVALLTLGNVRKRGAAKRKGAKDARARLGDAQKLAGDGDSRGFYGAVSAAIRGGLEARLGESVGGLTHDGLRRELRSAGMDEDLVRRVIEELESCDFARFSSAGGSTDEMNRCLDRTRALLSRVDRFEPSEART